VYFSGGHIEWYFGANGQAEGGDQNTENLRTREEMYRYMWYARRMMQDELPFWLMSPADNLVSGENTAFGGAEVFAQADQVYAVYLPNASGSRTIDLTGASNNFQRRWYNPSNGQFEGDVITVQGGSVVQIGPPPSRTNGDWVVLYQETDGNPPAQPEISAFVLYDADSDEPIVQFSPLLDGAQINLTELGVTNLNIQAVANSITGSVRFAFNGNPNFQTENAAPYALFGNIGPDYNPWPAVVGDYVVTATPFAGEGGAGLAGQANTVSFSIIESVDSDADGVADASDNCTAVANAGQVDFDADGYGNACDADFNNDCVVNFIDYSQLTNEFLSTTSGLFDLNADGVINFEDAAIFSNYFLLAPGPSGLTMECGN